MGQILGVNRAANAPAVQGAAARTILAPNSCNYTENAGPGSSSPAKLSVKPLDDLLRSLANRRLVGLQHDVVVCKYTSRATEFPQTLRA